MTFKNLKTFLGVLSGLLLLVGITSISSTEIIDRTEAAIITYDVESANNFFPEFCNDEEPWGTVCGSWRHDGMKCDCYGYASSGKRTTYYRFKSKKWCYPSNMPWTG